MLEPLYSLLRVVVLGRVRTVASDCTRLEPVAELLPERRLLLLVVASPLFEEEEEERSEEERSELLALEERLLSLLNDDARVEELRFDEYRPLLVPLYLLEELLPEVYRLDIERPDDL